MFAMFFNVVFAVFVCYPAAFCQLCFYNKDWIDWIGLIGIIILFLLVRSEQQNSNKFQIILVLLNLLILHPSSDLCTAQLPYLHSVDLILFTVLLVHLILRISPHRSHHLHSHHLSLPLHFTPDLKLISFTNPFLHSHSHSFRTDFTDLHLY